MLPFGLRDGLLVSVNDVERGLQKNVVCPSCQIPLVARKGRRKIHHFAHHNGADCPTGLQTVLHMRAKDIIAEAKSIFVPEHSIIIPARQSAFNIIKSQKVMLSEVWLEKRLDRIIPDVLARTSGIELLIEIRVSHAVEESKLDLIKSMNLRAIEVNLSDFHAKGYNDDILRERLIEQHVCKKWLSSPKINHVIENDLIATIFENCAQLPVTFISRRDEEVLCPAIRGSNSWMRKVYANQACVMCEYFYGIHWNSVLCGYNNKIKDYNSLQQYLKRKNEQTGL